MTMITVTQPPDRDPAPPLPPHPSSHMPPERFRQWRDTLEYWAAVRGLPPDPWPLP